MLVVTLALRAVGPFVLGRAPDNKNVLTGCALVSLAVGSLIVRWVRKRQATENDSDAS